MKGYILKHPLEEERIINLEKVISTGYYAEKYGNTKYWALLERGSRLPLSKTDYLDISIKIVGKITIGEAEVFRRGTE